MRILLPEQRLTLRTLVMKRNDQRLFVIGSRDESDPVWRSTPLRQPFRYAADWAEESRANRCLADWPFVRWWCTDGQAVL